MTTILAPAFNEKQSRAIQRILDQMDRTAQRTDQLYSRQRTHERKPYRGPVTLFFPRVPRETPPENGNANCYPAWSYSLSQGGVGLITEENTTRTEVWVGVHLPNHALRWIFGNVVRLRHIPDEDFVDYGIRFTPKAVEPNSEVQ